MHDRNRLVLGMDRVVVDTVMDIQRVYLEQHQLFRLEYRLHLGLSIEPLRREFLVYPTKKSIHARIRITVNDRSLHQLTSLVFKLGVERDELEPDRDGGLSAEGFELLPPGLSFPFNPMLSRESTAWSPFARGEGDSFK